MTKAAGTALAQVTTNLYDAAGNLTGTLDPNNNLTQFVYDSLNRQTVTVDALNHRTTSFFDHAGNLTGTEDANTNLTQYRMALPPFSNIFSRPRVADARTLNAARVRASKKRRRQADSGGRRQLILAREPSLAYILVH
jgi:YD repeat-containing protein